MRDPQRSKQQFLTSLRAFWRRFRQPFAGPNHFWAFWRSFRQQFERPILTAGPSGDVLGSGLRGLITLSPPGKVEEFENPNHFWAFRQLLGEQFERPNHFWAF